jgi:adenosylcobinamide-GDP ribazoletransferase
MRGLILALGFLTRLPVPALRDFQPAELARASVWFPVAGLVVGAGVAAAALAGNRLDPWLGALAALVVWVWISGGLHLDGLADSADALGAAHRDPARFLAVLADPHLGSFGVLALVLQVLAKLILLQLALTHGLPWAALLLIPAWARWAAAGWAIWLPSLKSGLGERFSANPRAALSSSLSPLAGLRQGRSEAAGFPAACPSRVEGAARGQPAAVAPGGPTPRAGWWTGGLLLLAASALWHPAAALALVPALGWGLWLKRRLGGQSGDLLGAGIEIVESAALLLALLALR